MTDQSRDRLDPLAALDELEKRIDQFESAYVRDLCALMRVLVPAEFVKESARQALQAYADAHARAARDYDAALQSVQRKELAGSSLQLGESLLPTYLLALERMRVDQAAARFSACESRLNDARRRSVDADAEFELLANRLLRLREERDQQLSALRQCRVALLNGKSLPRVSSSVRITSSPVDALIESLPLSSGTAAPARECHRCGADVPRGRRRFCSCDCRRLYLEENGSIENPKRSRFYDYGSDDLDDDAGY